MIIAKHFLNKIHIFAAFNDDKIDESDIIKKKYRVLRLTKQDSIRRGFIRK